MLRLVETRDLLVSTALWASRAALPTVSDDVLRWSVDAIMKTPPLPPMPSPDGRTITVRGAVAGRDVQAIWCDGRVSGDPLVVTMVEQLRVGHEIDLRDPWNFLLLAGSAFEQGTLDASGDLPDPAVISVTPA